MDTVKNNSWPETLYKHYTEEIRFIKKFQWQLIYYIFLLDSGLFYISKNCNLSNSIFKVIVIIIYYICIAGMAIMLLSKIQNSLEMNRKYLFNIGFDHNIAQLIGEKEEVTKKDICPEKDTFYLFIIRITILGSTLFFSLLLLLTN
jgi:hypothetical protein